MSIGEFCNREVVIARAEDSVAEAASLMRQHHVGDVLVVEERDGRRVPVGLVTDRDVVVEVVATGLDARAITLGDIMVGELATVGEDVDVFDAVQYMRTRGVRRLPVVSADGALAGIVTFDDVVALVAEELDALARLVAREQKKEASARR